MLKKTVTLHNVLFNVLVQMFYWLFAYLEKSFNLFHYNLYKNTIQHTNSQTAKEIQVGFCKRSGHMKKIQLYPSMIVNKTNIAHSK